MKKQIKDELSTLKKNIIETVPVERIFLFGSFYGTPNTDSVLDLYVVLQDSADIREIDAMKLIRKAICDKKTMPTLERRIVAENRRNGFASAQY